MIKDNGAWESWENDYKKKPVDVAANLRLLNAMFEEARLFHVFPLQDPLQDLPRKIELARAMNVSKAA